MIVLINNFVFYRMNHLQIKNDTLQFSDIVAILGFKYIIFCCPNIKFSPGIRVKTPKKFNYSIIYGF